MASPMPTVTDAELVREAPKGGAMKHLRPCSTAILVWVYAIAMAGVGRRESAEDLAQEVFLRAYLGLQQLRSPEYFAAWVARITRNLAATWRLAGPPPGALVPLVTAAGQPLDFADNRAVGAEKQMEASERRQAVREALEQLPVEQRELVLLHYMEELSQREIARRLGLAQARVSRQINRALASMRDPLERVLHQETACMRSSRGQAKVQALAIITAAAALPLATKATLAAAAVHAVAASAGTSAGIGVSGWIKSIKLFYTTGGKTMIAIKSLASLLGTLGVLAIVSLNINLAKAQNANRAEALKVLEAYTKTQDNLRSFIIKFEQQYDTDCRLEPPYDNFNGKYVVYEAVEVRSEGRRCCARFLRWGELDGPGSFLPKENANYTSYLFDGSRYIQFGFRLNDRSSRVPMGSGFVESKDYVSDAVRKIYTMSSDADLRGYLYVMQERVDSILRQAQDIVVSREQDSAGGPQCYVIRAKTKWGRYAIWLDPTHDYHIVRAGMHKEGGDLTGWGSNPNSNKPIPQGFTYDYTLSDIQFQKIGNQWVPMQATWVTDRKGPAGYYSIQKGHLKRTKVILSPDFDALHAFEPDDVRDGALFMKDTTPGQPAPQYIWQKGQLIPKK